MDFSLSPELLDLRARVRALVDDHLTPLELEAEQRHGRLSPESHAMAKAANVECKTTYSIAAAPWEAIIDAAKKNKCDAIVATVVAERALSADVERAALEFLRSAPVLRWAEAATGL